MNEEKKQNKYETVIGLEIHAELKTKSKMFCSCVNAQAQINSDKKRRLMQIKPNENVCPVCLGMPGALPVLNKKAIEMTIKTGLALNCKVNKFSKWDRKNYFYPDLPKGYQISQYDLPLVFQGYLEINSKSEYLNSKQIQNSNDKNSKCKKIKITRIHLEEDTGTSKHPEGRVDVDYSLLDFNRAGVPLMELVTDPDLRSAQEAKEFCKQYQLILRTLNVSDANMEKGQMRCEANISIRKSCKLVPLGVKVEVKNLNSFKSVERAIEYEVERQIEALESGEKVRQETRGWNEKKSKTYVMRMKETSADYRYFPEPDLPPIQLATSRLATSDKRPSNSAGRQVTSKRQIAKNKSQITNEINIEEIRKTIPELPREKMERYVREYKLSRGDALIIASNIKMAKYFEKSVTSDPPIRRAGKRQVTSKKQIINHYSLFAKWIINEIPDLSVQPKHLVELVNLIEDGKISGKIAKEILPQIKKGKSPSKIIKEKGLEQISDTGSLEKIVEKVIKDNLDAVKKIKSGQMGVMGFLVGKVMLATKGQANPKLVNEILRKKLK